MKAMSRDCCVQKLHRSGERPVAGRGQRFEGGYTAHIILAAKSSAHFHGPHSITAILCTGMAMTGAKIGTQLMGGHL